MAFTHTMTFTFQSPDGTIQQASSQSASENIAIDETITVGADREVALAIDVSQLKSLFIIADGALTLETNSSSAPDNTLTIQADLPFFWQSGAYETSLRFNGTTVSADITKIYLTNAGSESVSFRLRALVDATV